MTHNEYNKLFVGDLIIVNLPTYTYPGQIRHCLISHKVIIPKAPYSDFIHVTNIIYKPHVEFKV
jgi:hypothetical protein